MIQSIKPKISHRYLNRLNETARMNVVVTTLTGRYLMANFAPKKAIVKANIGIMMMVVIPVFSITSKSD